MLNDAGSIASVRDVGQIVGHTRTHTHHRSGGFPSRALQDEFERTLFFSGCFCGLLGRNQIMLLLYSPACTWSDPLTSLISRIATHIHECLLTGSLVTGRAFSVCLWRAWCRVQGRAAATRIHQLFGGDDLVTCQSLGGVFFNR